MSLPPPNPAERIKAPSYDQIKDNVHWWAAGILVVAALVAAALWSTPSIVLILGFDVAVLTFSHQLAHPRWRGKLQVAGVAVIWVGAAVLAFRNPPHAPQLGAWPLRVLLLVVWSPAFMALSTLVTFCTLFGWERIGMRWHRTRYRVNKMMDRRAKWHMAEGMVRFCVEVGLPRDTGDEGVKEMPRGAKWRLNVGTFTIENWQKLAHKIGAYFGLDDSNVEAVPTDNAAVIEVQFNMVDTLERMPAWEPSPATSITKPISLGLDYDLKPIFLTFDDMHVKVIGTTNAGKSATMEVPLMAVLSAPDARAWILDPAKSAVPFRRYKHLCDVFADTFELTVRTLHELDRVGKERAAWMAANGITVWPTSAEHPMIVVFIDEALSLTMQKPIQNHLYQLAQALRQAGIRFVFGAHRADANDFGSGLRGVIRTTILLAVDNSKSANMAIDGFPMPAHEYKMGGYCAFHQQGMRRPISGRIWHVLPKVSEAFIGRLSPPAPCDYTVSLAAAGSAIPEVRSQVGDMAVPVSATASVELSDVKALSMLRTLVEAGSALNEAELVRLCSDLGNVRTAKSKGALLAEHGYATAVTSTTWVATDAGRARMEQEVSA